MQLLNIHTIHKPKFIMQSNGILDLNPAINDVDDLIKGYKTLSMKTILSRLRDLEVFLKCNQAKQQGRFLYEDEKGRLIEARS